MQSVLESSREQYDEFDSKRQAGLARGLAHFAIRLKTNTFHCFEQHSGMKGDTRVPEKGLPPDLIRDTFEARLLLMEVAATQRTLNRPSGQSERDASQSTTVGDSVAVRASKNSKAQQLSTSGTQRFNITT